MSTNANYNNNKTVPNNKLISSQTNSANFLDCLWTASEISVTSTVKFNSCSETSACSSPTGPLDFMLLLFGVNT